MSNNNLNNKLFKHVEILKKYVFQVYDKWPQFELLLDDLFKFKDNLPNQSTIVSIERTLLYGGYSLIGPYFNTDHNFISLDCSPESADSRGNYNQKMINHSGFIKVPYTKRVNFENIDYENDSVDLLLIPNLVHHVKNQDLMFDQACRLLKKDGLLYIFEPLVRELHQIPDDFLRYTPYGLENILSKYGFGDFKVSYTGGPFSVLSYVWIQALEYFPDNEREKISEWFYSTEFHRLQTFDLKYKKNLVRKHSSFPTAFSIQAKKL